MSKKVLLVAGLLVAAGAAAAISAPSLRGQRHGSLLDDLTNGLGRATQQVSQAIGVSDEVAAPSREERRGRRAKQRRGGEDSVADEAAEPEEGKLSREASGGKGWRSKERLARQDDDDAGDPSEARRERRRADRDRAARDDDGAQPGRGGSSVAQDRSAQYFARLDKNGDGVIDTSEFVIAEAERIAERARQFFKRFDTDGDGKVTREEFNRGSRERFTAADPDNAGDVSPARGRAEVK